MRRNTWASFVYGENFPSHCHTDVEMDIQLTDSVMHAWPFKYRLLFLQGLQHSACAACISLWTQEYLHCVHYHVLTKQQQCTWRDKALVQNSVNRKGFFCTDVEIIPLSDVGFTMFYTHTFKFCEQMQINKWKELFFNILEELSYLCNFKCCSNPRM